MDFNYSLLCSSSEASADLAIKLECRALGASCFIGLRRGVDQDDAVTEAFLQFKG